MPLDVPCPRKTNFNPSPAAVERQKEKMALQSKDAQTEHYYPGFALPVWNN